MKQGNIMGGRERKHGSDGLAVDFLSCILQYLEE